MSHSFITFSIKTSIVEERQLVNKLKQSGKKSGEIADIMDCPRQIVHNALALLKKVQYI